MIEMMIVIAIIGILTTAALPTMQRSIIRARETSLRQTLFVFRDVIDQYYADNGQYPDDLEDLVEKKYIRAIPADPFTGTSATWVVLPPVFDEEGNVYDIHSGSYKISLEGVPYNEW